MKKPFTHDDIEFYIDVKTQTDLYIVKVYFFDGKPANHKTTSITFANSDSFAMQHGIPGVEQLMRDEEEYVRAGTTMALKPTMSRTLSKMR